MGKKKSRRRTYPSKIFRGGTMKSMPFIILGFVLIFGFYGISSYIDANKQTWAMKAQVEMYQQQRLFEEQLKKEQADAEWWAANGWLVTSTFYSLVLVVPATAAGYAMWHLRNKRIENSLRAKEGMFPLQMQGMMVVNPNILTDGVTQLGNQQKMLPGPAQFQLQLQALGNQGKAQIAQAVSNQPIKYAAQGKFLAGAYDRPIKTAEYHVVEDEVPLLEADFERLSLEDAFNQSKKGEWIIGQNPDDGELCRLNIESLIHHAIVGASGTGKTSSTGLLEMANAIRDGYHVIALDGVKQAVDWEPYYKHIEPVECNYSNFLEYIQGIENINHDRQTIIKQAGARNINELKSKKMAKLLIIIEEFGSMMRKLKENDANAYKLVASKLENLLSVGRSNGLSFLLIDQNPSKWPGGVTANITNYVAYRVGGKKGNAIDEYHLKDLKRTGQFFYEESKYDSWFTLKDIDKLLYGLPERHTKLLRVAEPIIDIIDNEGIEIDTIDGKYTPQLLIDNIDKTDNTPISTDKKVIKMKGEPITREEKEYVYQTYLDNDRKTNQTCKAIWGNAGGYTKYLKKVVEEYEA